MIMVRSEVFAVTDDRINSSGKGVHIYSRNRESRKSGIQRIGCY